VNTTTTEATTEDESNNPAVGSVPMPDTVDTSAPWGRDATGTPLPRPVVVTHMNKTKIEDF
jgi:hypothetical protein